MKKKYIFLAIFALIIVLVYFLSQVSFDRDTNQAKSVAKNYYKYLNNKNEQEFIKTVSNHRKSQGFVTIKTSKLLWIKEANLDLRYSYLKTGIGKTEKPYAVRVFDVIIYESYKIKGPEDNGIKRLKITLTKEQKSSPWLVTSIGRG